MQESQNNSGPLQVTYSNSLLKEPKLHQRMARQLKKLELLLQQINLLPLGLLALTVPFAHLRINKLLKIITI